MLHTSISTLHQCGAVAVWCTNLNMSDVANNRTLPFCTYEEVTVTVFCFLFSHLFYYFSYFLNDKLQRDGRDDILSHQNVNA